MLLLMEADYTVLTGNSMKQENVISTLDNIYKSGILVDESVTCIPYNSELERTLIRKELNYTTGEIE